MLSKLFSPESVALIGASSTPGKLGFDILSNLVNSDYRGAIYPVNPKGGDILGKKCFSNVMEIPGEIDLALIAVPAEFVTRVLEECGRKHIKNVVIISAGFKESDAEGAKREAELMRIAGEYGMHLVGPNCLGILNPHAGLNASFAEGIPKKGNVALVSQSGAMIVAIADWAVEENIGFSKIVSMGNKAGLNENDLLAYLKDDSETEVIALYLESFSDGKKFMELVRQAATKKPIIVFKSGTSESGAKAVSSHTGSLAGSNTAVKTALRQCGAVHAETIEDFFDFVRIFAMQPLPSGNRVAIITNAGGPGVIATDAVENSPLLQMSQFGAETTDRLRNSLPSVANIHNPVDVIGDALADRYKKAFEAVLADPEVHSLLTILTPQIMTEKEQTVRILHQFAKKYPKKIFLTSFMGGKNIEYAEDKLAEYLIPNFLSPNRAIECLEKIVWLQNWREEKNDACSSDYEPDATLRTRIQEERESGKTQLSPALVQKILEYYGIPIASVYLAQSTEEAIRFSEEVGFPVVLKIASDEILHKTEIGGVRLALKNEEEVVSAFREISENVRKKYPNAKIDGILVQKMHHFGREVIIGMKRDPSFGPLIMFGLGGVYVEVLKDVAFRVAPFSREEALKMIHEVKAIELLKGVRGEAPSDIENIVKIILKVSQLALDFPEISEFDLNPLLVLSEGEGGVVLDARFLLQSR